MVGTKLGLTLPIPSKDDMILINKVRAYERALGARAKALELAEKNLGDDRVTDKRHVFDFVFQAADFLGGTAGPPRPSPQRKTSQVDEAAAWFICRAVAFSVAVVGNDGTTSIYYTVSPAFRPWQLSGTISVRDNFRDRAWSNVPLPDAFWANNALVERLLPRAARLPGGTTIEATYSPTGAQAPVVDGTDPAPSPLGIDTITAYRVTLSLIGVEVRR